MIADPPCRPQHPAARKRFSVVGRFAVCRSYDRNSKAYMPWMLNERLGDFASSEGESVAQVD
jgi:hypothetical protein